MKEATAKEFKCKTPSHHFGVATAKMLADDRACIAAWWLNSKSNEPNEQENAIKQEFVDLLNTWVNAIKYQSLESQQIKHPAFLRIIAIGNNVLPYIFEEFSKRPFIAWFKALQAITGQDAGSEAKSFKDAVELWLEWGRENNYFLK